VRLPAPADVGPTATRAYLVCQWVCWRTAERLAGRSAHAGMGAAHAQGPLIVRRAPERKVWLTQYACHDQTRAFPPPPLRELLCDMSEARVVCGGCGCGLRGVGAHACQLGLWPGFLEARARNASRQSRTVLRSVHGGYGPPVAVCGAWCGVESGKERMHKAK
jgi:hypothetical protein